MEPVPIGKRASPDDASSLLPSSPSSLKRQRLALPANPPRDISPLEALPAEILQQVFLESCNANLLIAAPRIAVKASGSETVCRVAFAIAFYNHQLDEVLNILGLDHLTPYGCLPMQFSELRSFTKAVLGSRWCTCLWVQGFLVSLVDAAFNYYYGLLKKGYIITDDLYGEARALRRLNFQASDMRIEMKESDTHARFGAHLFNTYLSLKPADDDLMSDEFHQDNNRHWSQSIFRRIEWRFCGNVAFDLTLDDDEVPHHSLSAPFRDVVFDLFERHNLLHRETQPLAGLEQRLARTIKSGKENRLWEFLTVDFYCFPESQAYRIPPSLYVKAAIADRQVGSHESRGLWFRVHTLFEIDPYSLPRKNFHIQKWAQRARDRACYAAGNAIMDRFINKTLKDRGKLDWFNHQIGQQTFANRHYRRSMDAKILRYLKYGLLSDDSDGSHNLNANFINPRLDEHGIEVSDEEFIATADEDERASASISRKYHRLAKLPPELNFLSPSDFLDDQRAYLDRRKVEIFGVSEDQLTADVRLERRAVYGQEITDTRARFNRERRERFESEIIGYSRFSARPDNNGEVYYSDESGDENDPLSAFGRQMDRWRYGRQLPDMKLHQVGFHSSENLGALDIMATLNRQADEKGKYSYDDNKLPHEAFGRPEWWHPVKDEQRDDDERRVVADDPTSSEDGSGDEDDDPWYASDSDEEVVTDDDDEEFRPRFDWL